MQRHSFSRADIQELIERLNNRAWSPMLIEMPRFQTDVRSAAALLTFMLDNGMPVCRAIVEVRNGRD